MKVKTSLPLEIASAIVDKALEVGRQEGMKPLTVVVLDSGGRMRAMKSEDGSGLLRFDIAFGKAWGSLGMGMPSPPDPRLPVGAPDLPERAGGGLGRRFVPVPGGVLIEDDEGMTIGAVGISGDSSEKDEYCGVLAIRSVGLAPNPREYDPDWRKSSLSDQH